MDNLKLDKKQFAEYIKMFQKIENYNADYLFDVYDIAFDGLIALLEENKINNLSINSSELVSYIVGEYIYSTNLLSGESLKKFIENESFKESMASVAADKYLSLSKYEHRENRFINKYLPPISSIHLYVNLMLNIVNTYPKNNPRSTLIIDLLNKSLSISRSIINLLCDGYETQAFAIWRTLHECECTLILLDKYGDIAINSYLKHMRYGLAYKGAFEDKEEEARVIQQVKFEMQEVGLKSKYMKKFIEYGWINAIEDTKNLENYKLNFRDGLESLAGLHNYSGIYMTSSEILHSTPLLIYSNEKYFYYVTLLNLYESFFRIEKVFTTLFFSRVGDEGKVQYMNMRKLYYSQLVNIHKRESIVFRQMRLNKKGDL